MGYNYSLLQILEIKCDRPNNTSNKIRYKHL